MLGYIGVFFGNLIKAAVSRQREFLADASAVQFTRNPDGIAGAQEIRALAEGSRVRSPEAQEASHLFFGDAVGHFLGMFATHPPLVERIRRIDPSFEGDFSKVRVGSPEPPPSELGEPTTSGLRPGPAAASSASTPRQMVSRIGTVDPRQLAYASSVLTSIPDPLKAMAYEPYGARAIVFALLVNGDSRRLQAAQLDRLAAYAEPALVVEVEKILPMVHALSPELRLPLVSMVVPTLRRLSRDQFQAFTAGVRELIQADNQVSLVRIRLAPAHPSTPGPSLRIHPAAAERGQSPEPLAGPVRHVLAALAQFGSAQPSDAARAFALGIQALGWPGMDSSMPPRDLDLQALSPP